VPTALTAHGGPIGRPADDERGHQMSRRLNMDELILTGISHGKHEFSLEYPKVDGVEICMAHCKCGYKVQINHYRSYAGMKDLQKKWEIHIGIWKGWV
jgi:hypothetical protein